ncbi:hypothetical protein JXA63_00295 [Candidatus Woesebacteria bacterium]|nr:hypothetical protein [Candidatus Woesebacteria bacterium]
MAEKKKIKLRVRDTDKLVFEGWVDRISSYNEEGPFDIYPQHANFISIIKKQITLYNDGEKIKDIPLERAILKIKKDVAKVFLGIEILSEINEEEFNVEKKPPKTS